jgi:glycosyltransferase involved in cell wall biosynthesis
VSGDSPTLSIVCPAYNEEEVLPRFHRALGEVIDRLGNNYRTEVVYVDDGSRDGTLEVLRALAAADARVRYLAFSRNFGHQAALTAGLEAAWGDVVITMDSDLQHPPSLIPALLEQWQAGKDVVLTIRQDNDTGLIKRCTSRWFYALMRLLSDTEIRPAAADFRLMSRRAVDALLQMRESHRFLRGMVQWLGFPSAEIPFVVQPRAAGRSKYNLRRMLTLAADGAISFSRTPLRLVMVAGLLLGGLGLVGTASGIGYWLARSAVEAGWAVVLGALLLIGGGMLFALGIVGEYVGRIYEQVKARPLYVLKETGNLSAVKREPPRAAA